MPKIARHSEATGSISVSAFKLMQTGGLVCVDDPDYFLLRPRPDLDALEGARHVLGGKVAREKLFFGHGSAFVAVPCGAGVGAKVRQRSAREPMPSRALAALERPWP